MLCVNGKVNKSGQFRLLTFRGIPGRRMKELGSGSLIEIVVLDVDEIGLAQFGVIELQLWVTNRNWVMTDPIG